MKGTLNVLASCAKVPSLKRVVVTSSMAAVIFNGRPLSPDVVVDESWFSDPSFCEKFKVCVQIRMEWPICIRYGKTGLCTVVAFAFSSGICYQKL